MWIRHRILGPPCSVGESLCPLVFLSALLCVYNLWWEEKCFIAWIFWKMLFLLSYKDVVVQSISCVFCDPHGLQHPRLPSPSLSPRVCSNGWWCHPTISSSVVPFFSCLQSFPASGSFPVNRHFASGGQSIGVSVSASVLPMNIQDWLPLGLLSKGLPRVFSSNTVWKHQFFGAQPSLWSNSYIYPWLLGKP